MSEARSKYLTIDEAANYLNVSRKWVYVHIRELPVYRFGGQLRFLGNELDEWAKSRRYEPVRL